ncbi:MAG TPA: DUF4397 domain-containing protein [Holophaga sp.]|nr:DUF4397 domain-containing protein [Holophaga sp.]
MPKPLLGGLALASLALGLACTSTKHDPPASVRIVHASPDAPAVDVYAGDASLVKGAAYKAATSFSQVPSGNLTFKVDPAGTTTPVLTATAMLQPKGYYTVLAVGNLASIQALVVPEEATAPDAGKVKVRVVHAAPAAPEVDVYVTAPGADLAGATPAVAGAAFKAFSGALQVPAATYQIRIAAAGTQTVVYDSGPLPLAAGSDLVLAAVQQDLGPSPVTLLALSRDPAHPVTEIPDNRALVRAVHASPDAPAVDVVVNGQTALTGVTYPQASAYLPVPQGAATVQLNLAGTSTAVINAPATLVAPNAFSIFAVNQVAGLQLLAVADDLTPPPAGKAKLRALHLSPDAPAVDVWVNGAKVLSNVAFKGASAYLQVPAGATSVQIAVAGTTNIVLQSSPDLAAGGIYTAAAIGTLSAVPSAPLTLDLIRDK